MDTHPRMEQPIKPFGTAAPGTAAAGIAPLGIALPGAPPPITPIRSRVAPPYPQRGTGLLQSFVHAWNGLIHTVVYQRNMRIHLICAILVGLVGSGIPLGLAEKVTLIFCVLLIFFAEILNTALEQLVDLTIQEFDEKARIVKDAAAAGVFVLALGTVAIFAAILAYNWETVTSHAGDVGRQFLVGIPLAACAALLIMDWKRPKPAASDILLFACATLLFTASAIRSTSYVFSSMTYALVIVSGAAAWQRRRAARPA